MGCAELRREAEARAGLAQAAGAREAFAGGFLVATGRAALRPPCAPEMMLPTR